MLKKAVVMYVGFAAVLACASLARAEVLTRENWVPASFDPNTGQPLGDMYTFHCPSGGNVSASVDTLNPGNGTATLDPLLYIVGPTGTVIGFSDDDVACTVPTACPPFQCPSLASITCPSGGTYSLIVHAASYNPCGAGGYKLTVEVKNAGGISQSAASVNLGGGASRTIPKWADPNKSKKKAPALDDEAVPF